MGLGERIKKRAQGLLLAAGLGGGALVLLAALSQTGQGDKAPDGSPTPTATGQPTAATHYDTTAGRYNEKHFPEGMRSCDVSAAWHGGHLVVAVTTNPPGIHGAHINTLTMQSRNGSYTDGASSGLHVTIASDQRHIANGAGSYLDVMVVAPWGDGAHTTAECDLRPVPHSAVG